MVIFYSEHSHLILLINFVSLLKCSICLCQFPFSHQMPVSINHCYFIFPVWKLQLIHSQIWSWMHCFFKMCFTKRRVYCSGKGVSVPPSVVSVLYWYLMCEAVSFLLSWGPLPYHFKLAFWSFSRSRFGYWLSLQGTGQVSFLLFPQ